MPDCGSGHAHARRGDAPPSRRQRHLHDAPDRGGRPARRHLALGRSALPRPGARRTHRRRAAGDRARHLAGPTPAGSSAEPPYGIDPANDLRAWRAAIANHDAYDEVVLWFEHDLFDQLNLVQLLPWIRERLPSEKTVSLVCIGSFPGRPAFKGLGELAPHELAPLFGAWTRVSHGQSGPASRAGDAFRAPTPDGTLRGAPWRHRGAAIPGAGYHAVPRGVSVDARWPVAQRAPSARARPRWTDRFRCRSSTDGRGGRRLSRDRSVAGRHGQRAIEVVAGAAHLRRRERRCVGAAARNRRSYRSRLGGAGGSRRPRRPRRPRSLAGRRPSASPGREVWRWGRRASAPDRAADPSL